MTAVMQFSISQKIEKSIRQSRNDDQEDGTVIGTVCFVEQNVGICKMGLLACIIYIIRVVTEQKKHI